MGTTKTDQSTQKIDCPGCGQAYRVDCDWRQGRCPLHPPMIEKSTARKILFLLAAPVIIVAWAFTNPARLWHQVKQDWNLDQ